MFSVCIALFSGCTIGVSGSVKETGKEISLSPEGNFSFLIQTPDEFIVRNFKLKIGRMIPKARKEMYWHPSSGDIPFLLSLFYLRVSQGLPEISDPEYIFISEIKTNYEYRFLLPEGTYYASAESMNNADLSFSPSESREFIFTFGYSHEYPKEEGIKTDEFKENKCISFDYTDRYIRRHKFRHTAGAVCPRLEISKGKKLQFVFHGAESNLSIESIIVKPLFFYLLMPFTNGWGYYNKRTYTAETLYLKSSGYKVSQ